MVEPPSDEVKELERKRRTLYLMIGGAASLILPLLGALYIRMSDTQVKGPGGSGGAIFARRGVDGSPQLKVVPVLSAAPAAGSSAPSPAPIRQAAESQAGGSLGFIRGGSDYSDNKAAPPAPAAAAPQKTEAAPAPAAPEQKETQIPQPKTTAKAAARPVNAPKLKPTKGFNTWGKPGSGAKKNQNGEEQSGAAPDMGEMMKKMGGGAGGAPGGMPDIGAMMKNMGGGASGGAEGGTPDVSNMMKNMPGMPQQQTDDQQK